MLSDNLNPRSITNRAYYTMFYTLFALFIRTGMNIKTSKHTGVISLFDKEFVRTGTFDKYYSKILHQMFDARLERDYKELIETSTEDAEEHIKLARNFLQNIKDFTDKYTTQ